MRVLLVAAAGAAPARGPTQSAPGGFGAPLVRHVPVREELAALAPGRVLPFAPGDSRKRGPKLSRGATPANAAVERRKASAAGRTRGFARSAEGWCHPLRGEAPRDSRAYRRSASRSTLAKASLYERDLPDVTRTVTDVKGDVAKNETGW